MLFGMPPAIVVPKSGFSGAQKLMSPVAVAFVAQLPNCMQCMFCVHDAYESYRGQPLARTPSLPLRGRRLSGAVVG